MDAVAYGFSPLEIIWGVCEGRWSIDNIVGKPAKWFAFNNDNHLVFKSGFSNYEELPENKFILVRHRPSYENPYGVKTFSKCYWPAVFKKSGFRWWTVFVEKFGDAFIFGSYASNATTQIKDELLKALQKMASDAVAIVPEGCEVKIETVTNKSTNSSAHKDYIAACNAEMSKAVLGQTLTTEVGGVGSYAAAKTHNLVREDLARKDRIMICTAFNKLAAVWCYYNYGEGVIPGLYPVW